MKSFGHRIAALSVVVGLAFAAPHIAHADDSAEQQARVHFVAGVNLLRDPGKPRYDEAYAEFKRAYAIFPSNKMLGNIGFTAMKLERDAEAIDAYTRYLSEVADVESEDRAQIERDLATLKAALAPIAVESHPDGAILLDTRIPVQGEPITNAYGVLHGRTALSIRRGHHVLKARFPDGTEAVWELDVSGGEAHVFEAAPAVGPGPAADPAHPPRDVVASPERPTPKAVYVGALATVALGAGAIITGALALDAHSRFNTANDGNDPSRAEDVRSSGKTLNIAADVFTLSAVVAAGITAYLYLSRPAVTAPSSSARVGPKGLSITF